MLQTRSCGVQLLFVNKTKHRPNPPLHSKCQIAADMQVYTGMAAVCTSGTDYKKFKLQIEWASLTLLVSVCQVTVRLPRFLWIISLCLTKAYIKTKQTDVLRVSWLPLWKFSPLYSEFWNFQQHSNYPLCTLVLINTFSGCFVCRYRVIHFCTLLWKEEQAGPTLRAQRTLVKRVQNASQPRLLCQIWVSHC